jgi:ribose 5-phosphate isomerase B
MPPKRERRTITERDVLDAWQQRRVAIAVSPGVIVTPAARDAARAHGITLQEAGGASTNQLSSASEKPKRREARSGLVAIGSDHGGYALKEILKSHLRDLRYQFKDFGTFSEASVDYPDFAAAVAEAVASGEAWRGIIIDGAGIGSCIVANKIPGVRAALCHDFYSARNSREHNNANVLTLGSRVIGVDIAKEIVKLWLAAEFGGGRHAQRVTKIDAVEQKYLKNG